MRDDIKEVTIEIFAKPIGNVARKMGPYHLYIVYTDENSKKCAFAAGPEGRDGAAYDFIKATKENLRTTFETYGNIHPDWNKGNKHTKLLTIKSPLSEGKSKIEKIELAKELMNKFNAGKFGSVASMEYI